MRPGRQSPTPEEGPRSHARPGEHGEHAGSSIEPSPIVTVSPTPSRRRPSALSAHGPAAFTLARAAELAGVAAATLIKRFGSKRDLFVRLSRRWVASLDAELDDVEASCGSPLQCVRALALHNYHDLDDGERAPRQLAALAVDLQDAELRGLLHEGWEKVRARLQRQLAAAAVAGELVGSPPPAQLARIVYSAMEGGCLTWSVHPSASLVARLSADLDALLSGWSTRS